MARKENLVEDYLGRRVKELGGQTRKVIYQGRTGSPDQWCFLPGGILLIVECKAEGETPSAIQLRELKVLRELGFNAHWVDSREQLDKLLEEIK